MSLRISYAHSLKEKRSVLRKLKDKIRSRHDVKLAEVDGMDTWQSTVLGFALVGADRGLLESQADHVVRYIENLGVAELLSNDREVLYFGDPAPAGDLE